MQIIIMRHGAAVFRGADRILSDEGRDQAYKTACKLSALTQISSIYSSPKARARETAEIVRSKLDGDVGFNIIPDLSPSGNSNLVIDEIMAAAKNEDNVLLVSHIPIVEYLVHSIDTRLLIPCFDTANAYVLRKEEDKWLSHAFITPYSEHYF